jgi:gas vesicle protein
MSDSDNFGAFLVGFLVGGITGAVVALLYAPQPGEQTRTLIKDKAIELKDKTVDVAGETYRKVETVAVDTTAKAKETLKTVGDKASSVLKKGQVILENEKPAPKAKPAA